MTTPIVIYRASSQVVGEVTVSIMLGVDEVYNESLAPEANGFSYDLLNDFADGLPEGDHTVSVTVTDANGETATASTNFSVVYPEASVSIDSPAAGHTYDHTYRYISGRVHRCR